MNHTRLMTNNSNTYLAHRFKDYLLTPIAETDPEDDNTYLKFHYDDYNFWGALVDGDMLYLANRDGRSVLRENLTNKHLWSPNHER